MKSLSRRFLVGVGVMSMVMTVLGTVGAFVLFERELSDRQMSYLTDYVRERASNVDKRFSNLATLHNAAAAELERRVHQLPPAQIAGLADRFFPLQADGTRRSRPAYFDGKMENGDFTYGMGAYLGDAAAIRPDDMRALVAAFLLVSDFGQAARREYDNFYFFTPHTRLVMYGPDRPDHLMFYRHDAPSNLDISGEEMARVTLPALDPSRATRCTNLQRLVQDKQGDRLATACLTPAYIDGRYVGAFGSSMELSGFFANAVSNTLPGASPLIITGQGDLIAYPGFTGKGSASEAKVADYEKRLSLTKISTMLARDGRDHGVISSPDGSQIVAFGRLSGPNWYLLLTYPKALMAASAARAASGVLLIGGLASLLQAVAVVLLARGSIVRPVERLAASCEPEAFGSEGRPDVSDVEARRDEIGVLAKALRNEREKSEQVLASLEDRVHERTAELERANTEKSRFLANMSHELRTPLNGVIAISETLAALQTTEKGRELADIIASSGRLLEHVLTDILDFSKIEAGEIRLAHEPFSMERLVAGIAELHRASADGRSLRFEWNIAPEASGWFAGDTVRLTQILSNLLSNAVKFTEQGSVTLDVTERDGLVVFSVTDTGIGFDDAARKRLFNRFEQADTSIRRRFGGTGLGLAISRSLAELMDGHVEATSIPGQGSTFSFLVPLARRENGKEAVESDMAAPVDITGRRVLLAEDHPTNQKVVQLILDSVGIEPVVVENGALALERLAAEPFDVVLMDMQMPQLDGLTATAMLRARERENGLPRVPVIMLTANAMQEHVKASQEAGADLHLSKPIQAKALIGAIIQMIAATELASDKSAAA